ncbi:hypothetical protein [Pseudomonas sp. RA_35y_Pfl2_P32]|uniref:hypothetical protein n=1 Tax=Pseudomonas sp. RA_35y_Pfl2_P32 TaxID=3088705 RepID=UPI0030D92124
MKTQLILALTLSVLAANTFAADGYDRTGAATLAEDGYDRTPQGQSVAEGGRERLEEKGLVEVGYDRSGSATVAEDGYDRTGSAALS